MQLLDIKRMARNILENQNIESSFIEYKKSANFKDKILKTACAFANNYMNNEIGLLFIGIEEIDDKETGEKAIPTCFACIQTGPSNLFDSIKTDRRYKRVQG